MKVKNEQWEAGMGRECSRHSHSTESLMCYRPTDIIIGHSLISVFCIDQ